MTDVNSALIEHLRQRAAFGKNKYGIELRTFDGRNTLADALEEVLDLAVYIKKEMMERESLADLCSMAWDVIDSLMVFWGEAVCPSREEIASAHAQLEDMAQKLRQDIKRIEPEEA